MKSIQKNLYQKKLLGSGAFGEVWLVPHRDLVCDFAMKIIKKEKINQTKRKKY